MEEKKDMTCLGEGIVFETDPRVTGLNLNEIVVGATGCGKSYSTAYPRLLHTYHSSVVVPIAKRALKDKFENLFRKRGYEVITLDFANPQNSLYGYDPLDYAHSNEDIVNLARNMVDGGQERTSAKTIDPYWGDSAVSMLAAEIQLIRMNAKEKKETPRFADVIRLHRCARIGNTGEIIRSSLDTFFDEAELLYPGNQGTQMWNTFRNLPVRTASCILSTLNTAVDKIFTESVLAMMKKGQKVQFGELGERKIALFIVTSPMNVSLQNLVNILYADLFRCLFEKAEANPDGRLSVPVHIICDDFACGSRISGFDSYISIFRAAGISVTMLLQSESQLEGMYGKPAATTIINNCDTYVYMGGMDIETCRNISCRMNKPLERVMGMPREQVVVFRRGMQPMVTRRYQILDDPLYAELERTEEKEAV